MKTPEMLGADLPPWEAKCPGYEVATYVTVSYSHESSKDNKHVIQRSVTIYY